MHGRPKGKDEYAGKAFTGSAIVFNQMVDLPVVPANSLKSYRDVKGKRLPKSGSSLPY
jgi:hypothetical protein